MLARIILESSLQTQCWDTTSHTSLLASVPGLQNKAISHSRIQPNPPAGQHQPLNFHVSSPACQWVGSSTETSQTLVDSQLGTQHCPPVGWSLLWDYPGHATSHARTCPCSPVASSLCIRQALGANLVGDQPCLQAHLQQQAQSQQKFQCSPHRRCPQIRQL